MRRGALPVAFLLLFAVAYQRAVEETAGHRGVGPLVLLEWFIEKEHRQQEGQDQDAHECQQIRRYEGPPQRAMGRK